MVYDKVALGRGNNPASNFKSGIISQITKPSETTSTDKVVNLVLLHPFLGSRGQWRPFLRSLHSALEAQGITAQAFIPDMRLHGQTHDLEQHRAGGRLWDALKAFRPKVPRDDSHPTAPAKESDSQDDYSYDTGATHANGAHGTASAVPEGFPSGNAILEPAVSALVSGTSGNMLLDMALDLDRFISSSAELRNNPPVVIGHSLGGKAALLQALARAPGAAATRGVISLDAAPAVYMHTHGALVQAMLDVDTASARSRQEVGQAMAQAVPDANTRAFALMQLVQDGFDPTLPLADQDAFHVGHHVADAPWRWQVGLPALQVMEDHVHSWPVDLMHILTGQPLADDGSLEFPEEMTPVGTGASSSTDVLFIGGDQSSRLTTPAYTEKIPEYFPNHELSMFRGGHFVHQGPEASRCAEACASFILNTSK